MKNLMVRELIHSMQRLLSQDPAELSASERQLQSIISHMGDGLIAIDEQGIIQLFNPASERIFGYPAAEAVGRNVSMLMPEPHRSRHDGYLTAHRARGSSTILGMAREFEGQRKDGSVFPLEITITDMQWNGKTVYTATFRDISERKKAEEERRRLERELNISRERFQLVVDGTVDGIWDWPDCSRDEVYWSPQWKTLLGYQDHEITGSRALLRTMLHPDDLGRVDEAIQACIKKGEIFNIEYRLKRKSGEYRWFHGKAMLFKNDGAARMTGSITDITERKFADAIREQLIKQLTDANEQLEQFAYVASHDLREPLRIVVSFTDLLSREYDGLLDGAGKEYMGIIRKAAKKMEAMVADLLDYGRLGQQAERFMLIDCNVKLELAKEALAEAIRSTGAVIESDDLPHVMGNPLRFSRLFQNLIGNAIKYQRPGQAPLIRISAEDKGEHWQFAVADNGIGIQPQYLELIFEPFKRLHSDREFAGTGMGLAICKKIVEGHGGKLWAQSDDHGAAFLFTIPKCTD